MAILPSFYIKAVVAIGVGKVSKVKWVGTGFLSYRIIDDKGNECPFLITNKHVLEEKKSVIIRLKKKDSDDFVTLNVDLIKNNKPTYVAHPVDDVDIAVLPLNANFIIKNQLAFDAFNIDSNDHVMTSEELREEGADEGSLIHMLGFPMGLVNENSTLPICRLGCIARMSKAQIDESYNIMVDIQNFPGNSGSPVVIRPELTSISGTKALKKCVLIGIVHSYLPYEEELINRQTKRVVEIKSENSGLALVHPVEYIREVVDLFAPKVEVKSEQQNEDGVKNSEDRSVSA